MDSISINKNGICFNVIKSKYDWFWEDVINDKWETQTFRLFDSLISQESTFIDLGAWIGATTLYAANLAKIVYAFEPDPFSYEELNQNLKVNSQIKNIKAYNCFVGNITGKIKMGSQREGGDSLSSIFFTDKKTNWFVESTKLEDFIKKQDLNPPLFIKMDIEGSEYFVVPTLSGVFKKYEPILYLSLHPFLLIMTVKGDSLFAKIKRRMTLLLAHFRIIIGLRNLKFTYDIYGKPINLWTRLVQVLIRGYLVKDNSFVAMSRVWKNAVRK